MYLGIESWENELFDNYNDEHIRTQEDAEEDAWNALEGGCNDD